MSENTRIFTYVPGIGMCMYRGRDIINVVKLLDGRNRDIVPITREYLRTVLGLVNTHLVSDEWDCLVILASQYHPRGTAEDDAAVDDLILDVVQNYAPVRLA